MGVGQATAAGASEEEGISVSGARRRFEAGALRRDHICFRWWRQSIRDPSKSTSYPIPNCSKSFLEEERVKDFPRGLRTETQPVAQPN
jgi:hypothetical protein